MMSHEDYLNNLHRRYPVVEPTIQDILSIAPHLSQEQAEELLSSDESSVHFATPPTRILHGFLTFWLYRDDEGIRKLYSPHGNRTIQSYADGNPKGDLFYPVMFDAQAMAYGEEHWPEKLVLDTWVDYGTVVLDDPADLWPDGSGWGKFGSPKTKFVVHWTLNRRWNDLINDHSKPQNVLWNEALVEITIDPIVGSEIKGGRGGFTEFNCAGCGGGLDLTCCPACGIRFRDNHMRMGCITPLPEKMVNLLQNVAGHEFRVNPKIQRDKEQVRFDEFIERLRKAADERELSRREQTWLEGQKPS